LKNYLTDLHLWHLAGIYQTLMCKILQMKSKSEKELNQLHSKDIMDNLWHREKDPFKWALPDPVLLCYHKGWKNNFKVEFSVSSRGLLDHKVVVVPKLTVTGLSKNLD
jgi:hypothetical protein